jgi:potassium-transporting ATPase KdpC subunit
MSSVSSERIGRMAIGEPRVDLSGEMRTSVRILSATLLVCCVLYGLAVLLFAQILVPAGAAGSLVRGDGGEIRGSELIAQGFTQPGYFWSRPSAVGYNASASGGSNLSPTSPELRRRTEALIASTGATADNPLPAEMATASGSGLDPHLTLSAAEYQAGRVAAARGLPVSIVSGLIESHASRPGLFSREPLVNVLILNMALDRLDD